MEEVIVVASTVHLHQTMEFQIVNSVMLMVNQTHLLTLSLLLLWLFVGGVVLELV